MMSAISFLLNALVGVFLMRFAGDDLFGKNVNLHDDRALLWFMFLEGILFFVFGASGLIFA